MSTNGSFWNQNGVPPNTDPSGINARFVIIDPVIGGIDAINAYDALAEHQLNIDTLTTNLAGVTGSLAGKQPLDATLTALAAQTATAGQVSYATGTDTFGLFDTTAYGRTWANLADAASARTNLGLVIGTNVQAYDAELAAIAGLTSAADRVPYFTGAGTAALGNFTAFGRGLVAAADNTAFLAAAGLGNAANRAIGTSGANVPLLNATNTWSGAQAFNNPASSVVLSSTNPVIDFDETDATTNKRRWRSLIDGGIFRQQMVDDAYTTATDIFNVSRTAHTAATFTFPATTTPVFAATPIISNTNPQLRWQDTNATANENWWRVNVNGQFMEFQTGTDAFAWDTAWFMQRTAGVVTSIQFGKPTQVNGAFTATSTLNLASSFPLLATYDSDAGTDAKRWRWQTDSGVHSLRIGNDADSAYISVYDVTRTANTSAAFDFPSTTTVSFAGQVLSSFGRNLIDDADSTAARTTLGLGTAATQNTGTYGSAIPLLNGSNTWTGQQFLQGGLALQEVSPQVAWLETDAGANLKNWDMTVNGGVLYFRLVNDAFNAVSSIFEVTRTAHTAAAVTFPSTTTLAANGVFYAGGPSVTFATSPTIVGVNPQLDFWETDGGTNTQRWRHLVNTNTYSLDIINDDYSAFTSVYNVTRTGHTAATVTFPSTTTVSLGGDVFFNGNLFHNGASPSLTIGETDAGTNLKYSRQITDGGVFYHQLVNDAYNTFTTVYSISRTNHTAATVTFPATTTFTANGSSQFNGSLTATSGTGIEVSNAAPTIRFYENDQGTNLKRSRFLVNGGFMSFQVGNDADSTYINAFTVGRSTNVSTTVTFPSTNTTFFDGTAQFSVAARLSNNIPLNGRNAANSADIAAIKVNASDRIEVAGEEIIPWTTWTPTVSIVNGSVTLTTLGYARYRKQGRICFYEISAECTPNAGNTNTAGELRFTTPITPSRDQAGGGGYETSTGHALYAKINQAGGYIACLRATSWSPLRDPANANNVAPYIVLSGWYEVA